MREPEIWRDPQILDDLDGGKFQGLLGGDLLAACLVIQRQCHKQTSATGQQHHQTVDSGLFDGLIRHRVLTEQVHEECAEGDHRHEQISGEGHRHDPVRMIRGSETKRQSRKRATTAGSRMLISAPFPMALSAVVWLVL